MAAAAATLLVTSVATLLPGRPVTPSSAVPRLQRCLPPQLNVFDNLKQVVDGVKGAYDDEEYCPEGFVRASHILFLDSDGRAREKAGALKARIDNGDFSFGDAALEFSSCPTRDLNGKLGVFQSLSRLAQGTLRGGPMPYDDQDTAAFDALLFSEALGVVHQVDTQWGTHLLLIEERGADGTPPTDLLAKSFEAGVEKAAGLMPSVLGANAAEAATSAGFGGSGSSKAKKKRNKKKRR